MHDKLSYILAGLAAGAVNGFFGAGGGMVLVPLLCWLTDLEEDAIFPTSLSVILPICLVSLAVTALKGPLPWNQALPYLAGSTAGGIAAGLWGQRIPVMWLHRLLGLLILWGGAQFLCQ